jgi:hypothetical protein
MLSFRLGAADAIQSIEAARVHHAARLHGADQVRAGDQSQDRKRARPHRAAAACSPGADEVIE